MLRNKGRTERSQRRLGRWWTGPSPAGGRRQGGGERSKLGPRNGTPTKLGPRRGEGTPHLGRVRPSSSWRPELLGQGRQKTQAQPSLCFCGGPENLNLSSLGLGSPCNAGTKPYRAAWSLSTVDGESTHTRPERWQTQCGWNTAGPPHTGQWYLSAGPLPPHSTTEPTNLNKRPPPPACVRAEIRH